ncbi:MAG: GDP-mannose 4,6-dehydratase [Gemmatimonadales bacterium]|nr:GDP-mannose 4,6-dehydratase [Gemmatimonadales bacterium]
MSRLLVTGADGFVGRWLVRAARAAGHHVVAAIAPDGAPPASWLTAEEARGCEAVEADLRTSDGIRALGATAPDAVVHLAAMASGAAARQDPAAAWALNAGATAALADALAHGSRPTFLLVSTGEVYGRDHSGPIPETALPAPCSPYAASKVGAEVAALEVRRRTGLPVVIARPFPHTGPGQAPIYVLAALAARLRVAAAAGATEVTVGNLAPVRDLLDVRDVVQAYLALLEKGVSGEAYNVASGTGHRLSDCFDMLARLAGTTARPVQDAALLRAADLPILIGDPTRIRTTTGWLPRISLDRTLQDLVHAQAH